MSNEQITRVWGKWEGYRVGTVGRFEAGQKGPAAQVWIELVPRPGRPMVCGGKGSYEWVLRDARFNDNGAYSVDVGRYQPNPWGLCDMHGNVAEWTASPYRPYPYREDAGAGAVQSEIRDPKSEMRMVVRGGSWYDRPHRATSSFRLGYPAWQRVYNVGFRLVCEAREDKDRDER